MKIEQVVQWLESGTRKEKRAAIKGALELGFKKQGKEAIPHLMNLVNGSDSELAENAIGVIFEIDGKQNVEFFKQQRSSQSLMIRGICLRFLAQLGEKTIAYPALRSLLNSNDAAEREVGNAAKNYVPGDFDVASISAAELRESQGVISASIAGTDHVQVGILTKAKERFSAKLYFNPDDRAVSPVQFLAIQHIEKLGKLVSTKIAKELVRRHKEVQPSDPIPRGEACVLSAVIPRMDSGETAYFFVLGLADVECHRNFVCLFRNSEEFCPVEPDVLERFCVANDLMAFEQLWDACV